MKLLATDEPRIENRSMREAILDELERFGLAEIKRPPEILIHHCISMCILE
jgi:hypothetical protein